MIDVVKILGYKKTAKNGFMFHLKFPDDTSDWSTYGCTITDCTSLVREYMHRDQKVSSKETKSTLKPLN